VKLWDASTMEPKLVLPSQPDWPTGLAFALGGKVLAVGRLDGSFELYGTQDGKPKAAVKPPPPPKPELLGLEPRGLRSGTETRMKLTGRHLKAFEAPRVHGSAAKIRLDGAIADDHAWIVLDVPASPAAGQIELSLAKGSTESARIKAFIEPLPQVAEGAPAPDLPASFWGTLRERGETDEISFEARAGEEIVLDAAARRVGSKAELVLSLHDAQGRLLAENVDFEGEEDPLIVWRAPADGRYAARVRDLQLGGSTDHGYRLSIGALPLVTTVFPLAVPARARTSLRLVGHNLPAEARVEVEAGEPGMLTVPLDAARFRSRRAHQVAVSELPEILEAEDNDRPDRAQPLAIPGGASGGFSTPGDADHYRFEARAGQDWVIETEAARRGLPTDTRVEILHPDGRPVPRVLLRAVRDSYLTFRPIDANAPAGRFWQWEEMDLGQYLYLQGEVVRLFLAPRGPDSTWDFFALGGKRRNYFDTSAVAHPLDEPAYIVEPLPPGSTPPPNGLPVFPLAFVNDDDPERRWGSDSRLHFKAPADGPYLLRLTDSRGGSGPRHLYRVVVREARPDFEVSVQGATTVPAGSGTGFTLVVDRRDGFEGPVKVEIDGLPEGFHVSSPLWIEEGKTEAKGVLYADADATRPEAGRTPAPRAAATARIAGREVRKAVQGLAAPDLAKAPRTRVWLQPDASAPGREIVLQPGGRVPALIRIRREGHDERVTFDLENLPFGCVVDDIGLNGILIPEGQTERRIFLNCASWVEAMTRPAFARVREGPNPASAPLTIRVPARN
jgi:hypothetical protein